MLPGISFAFLEQLLTKVNSTMKFSPAIRKHQAFTLFELFVVVLVIGVLASMLLPALNINDSGAPRRSKCQYNLKQIGLSLTAYTTDHQEAFPWEINSNLASARIQTWQYFRMLSNELGSPKALICPADILRPKRADAFSRLKDVSNLTDLGNNAVSYFLAVNTKEKYSSSVMIGERNLSSEPNSPPYSSSKTGSAVYVGTNCVWTEFKSNSLHSVGGNVGLVDGSITFYNNEKWLQKTLSFSESKYGTNVNKFLFPQ